LGADDVLGPSCTAEELYARVERSIGFKQRMDGLIAEGRKLEHLSVTDGLTQVYNHRFFRERLNEEFKRVQRYEDGLALLFVDLDFFKDVNDLYGHLVGDAVLRAAAQAVRACLRDVDVPARYGGEEFAVLLPQTSLEGALTVAERIRKDIQKLRLSEEPQLRVTASVGVAAVPNPHIQSADQLVGAADAALYRAKREGRNRVLTGASDVTSTPFLVQRSTRG
jgi:diguanylate cyclase (GGDEF)-like protein